VTADPRIRAALDETRRRLLSARTADGAWRGELSSSALSTATAVAALARVDPRAHAAPMARGVRWLVEHANADGGWGDTPQSRSNLPTTTLVWSALAISPGREAPSALLARCEAYLAARCGGLSPEFVARAIVSQYGRDRTFSAPILAMCALAGRLGERPSDAWALVPQLPFELGILPHSLLRAARLPVVSYALPALIAVGQARDRYHPVACPLTRVVRRLVARARQTTSSPSRTSRSARWLPTNPVAPVTSAFMSSSAGIILATPPQVAEKPTQGLPWGAGPPAGGRAGSRALGLEGG